MLDLILSPFGIVFLIIIATILTIAILASLYTIVPADYADVVIQRGRKRVYSSQKEYSPDEKSAYFKIPSWFFIAGLGMKVHRMPLRILDIPIPDFLAFDKDRARFLCDIVAYAIIKDPIVSAMRFPSTVEELGRDISKVVRATTRDSTTKKPIREIINDREGIIKTINGPLSQALSNWGLELRDVELVEFKDPTKKEYGEEEPPHVIRDISSIVEVQINSEARQKNAEQRKIARLKEAQAEEEAKRREIERDEKIGTREKIKDQEIAKEHKIAKEQELEVTKVDQVKSAEIEKEKQIVVANQNKEVEKINKEKKQLEGEGDRLMLEEQAKGNAAEIREKGLADAVAKEKLQQALNKFEKKAITALVAQDIVEMERQAKIETAKALASAELRVFSGGEPGKKGFDLAQLLESVGMNNKGAQASLFNRIAQPNDLGFKKLNFEEWIGIVEDNKELRSELKKVIDEAEQLPEEKEETNPKRRKRREHLP